MSATSGRIQGMRKLLVSLLLLVPATVAAFPVGPADHLIQVRAHVAHRTTTGAGVRVAVVDNGAKGATEEKVFTGEAEPFPGGHATTVADVVRGVAPGTKIVSVKVGVDTPQGNLMRPSWVRSGIVWAVDNADVVNLSIARAVPDQAVADAIKAAVGRGTIVVVCAGNEGPDDHTTFFPARMDEVITVAAVDDRGKVAPFSSRGPTVFCAAPGVNVFANGSRHDGTSLSAPIVSGVAALWIAANPYVERKNRPTEFKRKIASLGTTRTQETGYGLVDAGKVVAK